MSRSVAAKHLRAALSRWPQDILRPQTQLHNALAPRLERLEQPSPQPSATATPADSRTNNTAAPDVTAQLREINALFALLDNRFKNRYRVGATTLRPRSRPGYYDELIKELDEAPTRSVWSRFMNRIKGMVRLE